MNDTIKKVVFNRKSTKISQVASTTGHGPTSGHAITGTTAPRGIKEEEEP
jgi:hypothetical protein